ncbi:MAG: PA14 domain-containing protein [Planctomycetota bacterium]|jgi:hypothetical protein
MITRNRIRTVLTLATVAMAIVGLTIPSANAKIIVEEQFIYEPLEANIDGQNGGIGFDGPWISTISHGRIYWVHSPGLSFSTLPVAGNALSRLGSAGRAEAHRLISGASQTSLTGDGTTMWFRALFQEPVNQFKHGSFLFGTDAFTTDGTPTLSAAGEGFGFTIQAAPSGSTQGTGTINALAFDGSTTPTVVEGTFTPDPITATVLIVGKINWKADGTPDELYLFNVTDLSTEPLEGTAFASITNLDFSQSAFDLIAMWDSNNSITDEIRFGNTFADLMGVVKTESSSDPSPADDALLTEFMMGILATTLTWKPGDFAESHNVYFGDDFDAVNDGTGDTFQGNQPKAVAYFIVGYGYTPEDPLPGGLVPGTTYYWRIDEVNDTDPNSPWKGDIWSFRLPPTKAYEPAPTDGSTFIDPNADLSWEPGMGGVVQTVYIGEDYDAVNNGTVEGVQVGEAAYDPGPLEYDTTYYWRVETAGPTYGQIKGDVWSFTTTLPGLGTIVSERWDNIDGQDLDALKNYWKYPNNPDTTEVLTRFSSTPGLDSYGGRIHGWLYVPSTGDYTFWLNTDDNGELWLSTNDDSTNIELIAQESSYTGLNAWGNGEEQSDPIPLQAGEKYYIMALWKEGGGGDHCQVAWQGPGVPERMVIPGTNLSPYKPLKAFGANPFNRTTGVTQTPVLQWKPGIQAASHELYFGTDEDVVRNATKASPEYVGPIALGSESYDPGKLAWESTYYWRVDEVNNTNPESPWVGSVWNFTTADYAIVDDFEDYNVTDNQIWAIWHDGIGYWDLDGLFHPGNGTGSGVGDEDNDVTYMEETIFHSGNMSMPYFYKNNDPTKAKYSEAKKTLVKTRDWTEGGVKALSLWFRGNPPDFLEDPAGTFTFSADGADIWTGSDEFRYVYKQMSGDGEIIARVVSIGGPGDNEWRKAGVMIRETLDPASLHAFMAVTPEPSHGLAFQCVKAINSQVTIRPMALPGQ